MFRLTPEGDAPRASSSSGRVAASLLSRAPCATDRRRDRMPRAAGAPRRGTGRRSDSRRGRDRVLRCDGAPGRGSAVAGAAAAGLRVQRGLQDPREDSQVREPSRRCRCSRPSSTLASRFTTIRRTARRTRTSRSGLASSASMPPRRSPACGIWWRRERIRTVAAAHGARHPDAGVGRRLRHHADVRAGRARTFLEFGNSSVSTHRAVAFTSIGIGTAGYLMMFFGGK